MILLDQKRPTMLPLEVASGVTFDTQRGFSERNFLSDIYITEPMCFIRKKLCFRIFAYLKFDTYKFS